MQEYKNEKELYQALIPAINVKLKLLKKSKINNIKKEDIWNYLKQTKWKNSTDLTLGEMVQDIIHTDNIELVKNKKDNMKG